jgi:hypothetical protein
MPWGRPRRDNVPEHRLRISTFESLRILQKAPQSSRRGKCARLLNRSSACP